MTNVKSFKVDGEKTKIKNFYDNTFITGGKSKADYTYWKINFN
jgi:hypothetical protein